MNFCHLYNTKTASPHREILLNSCKNIVSINILNDDDNIQENHNIYIFELEHVNKELTNKVKKIFETLTNTLIYFIVPQEYGLSLIQLAFLVDAKSIITSKQDTHKVIAKIKKDYQLHSEKINASILGEKLLNNHSYMLFKESKLSFASEQFLREFECSDLTQVEKKVCSKLDLDDLLSNEPQIKHRIANNISQDSNFFIKSVLSNNESIISFDEQSDYEPRCPELSYISTKMHFIELLKDKLLEKMMSVLSLTLLVIKLSTKPRGFSKLDEIAFRKEFLFEIELILSKKLIMAEYDSDHIVILFEKESFAQIQDKAKNFHLQMANFLNRKDTKYVVSLYAVNIEQAELSPVLQILDTITQDSVDKKILQNKNIEYINNFQENMDEKEIINYLLDSIFLNTSDLKLLNIHNGMCVNTSSQILKKTKDSIYVKIQQLQGIIMSIDKKTILQSSLLSKSIQASVEYINITDGYAIPTKFRILDYNPNTRQHGRVTSSKLTPIAISLPGSTIKGELIDISATSIAIKVKKTQALRNIINKEIGLTFYLDNKNSNKTAQKMTERATILHESEDNKGFSKLICLFLDNQENEDLLIDYIFSRQKNIIQDMRELASSY